MFDVHISLYTYIMGVYTYIYIYTSEPAENQGGLDGIKIGHAWSK